MHFDKLFELYLEQAKKQALTLHDNERTRACQWIKKIELAPSNQEEETKKLQLHSIKLLLLSLESNCFIGPFEESPVEEKDFGQYDWDSYQLTEFSNMIRSKQRDTSKCPEISYAVSGNRRQFVTYQDDPASGQHCYYACSKQPIEQWDNLRGGIIQDESIDHWRERGELEELNGRQSQISSIDMPRCVMRTPNFDDDWDVNDEQHTGPNTSRSQRLQNEPNKSNSLAPGLSRTINSQRIRSGRPPTPQRFGGRGQPRPYDIEQFGLSQNEQFRSPRGVFQNLDYDRLQSQRSPLPPRLTDEVIDSFENARLRRSPLSEVKQNEAKQQMCARLQAIRDGMNKKPQVEIEHQIEVEPEMVYFEPITLQEPCEETPYHEETDQDLGILSPGDMDDEVLFNENQSIDPKTIFKTKDENLISRNVVKIETNTMISGSKREVSEEILEQEDVNVVDKTEDQEENLVDVSEPIFESPSGFSPLILEEHIQKKPEQSKYKPRRILADYSDLPEEDLEDISRPYLGRGSFCEQVDSQKSNQMKESIPRPPNSSKCQRRGRNFVDIDKSERLEDESQPIYASSFEETNQRSFLHDNESGRSKDIEHCEYLSRRSRDPLSYRPQVHIETMDKLDEESQPSFGPSLQDSRGTSRYRSPYRHLPQVEISEKIDEISQPSGLYSRRKTKCPMEQGRLPQMPTSERLDQISQPDFVSFTDEACQSSMEKNMCRSKERYPYQTFTSERIDQISQPCFQDSTVSSRRSRSIPPQKRFPQVDLSERLDDVSQPDVFHSTEISYQDSSKGPRCPTRQRPLPQVETSERLDQVSYPRFVSSIEATSQDPREMNKCPAKQRPRHQVEVSERIEQLSPPSLVGSLQCRSLPPHRRLPRVETVEKLDEISQPEFLHSTELSYQDSRKGTKCPKSSRPFRQVESSERLDQMSPPRFASSIEDNSLASTDRRKCPLQQKTMQRAEPSEEIDQISQPSLMRSSQFQSLSPHRRLPVERLDKVSQEECYRRCPRTQRSILQSEMSERLDQVSQPTFFSNETYQDHRKRSRSPRMKTLPGLEMSQGIGQITPPSFPCSFQDSTVETSQNRAKSPRRPLPQMETLDNLDDVSQPAFSQLTDACETSERLDQISRPKYDSRDLKQRQGDEIVDEICKAEFQSGYEKTNSKLSGRGQVPDFCQVNDSEWLDDVLQPECPSSFSASSVGKTKLEQSSRPKNFLSINDSERLESICEPDFPLSFQEDKTQQSCRHIQDKSSIGQKNQSERLDNISQPYFPSSIGESMSLRKSNFPASRPLPQVDESELLEAIIEPHLTSYEDSGNDLKDSVRKTPLQRAFFRINCKEKLEDESQPKFQSYEECVSRSGKSRSIQKEQPSTSIQNSKRLEEICERDLPSFSVQKSEGFQSAFEDSNRLTNLSRISGKSKSKPRQKLLSRIDTSEVLDEVSRPIYQSSIEDSMHDRQNRQVPRNFRRPFYQDKNSECLENVSEPVYPNSYERSNISSNISQIRPQDKVDTSERLSHVCQPSFPTSFEDSNRSSRRYFETPKRRPLPIIENSENLEDIVNPSFYSSCEESFDTSKKCRNLQRQRPLPQIDESENLEDISQPDLSSSFKHSTAMSRDGRLQPLCPDDFRKPCLRTSRPVSVRRGQSVDNRPYVYRDTSERLIEVNEPKFAMCIDETLLRSARTSDRTDFSKQKLVSEKLDDICQPSFPDSEENSSRFYRRNIPRPIQERFNPDLSCPPCLAQDQLGFPPGRGPHQFDTSEMLEDVSQPDFPSNISRERERMAVDNRPMPQIDTTENIDSVFEPQFPESFEEGSSTYRKKKEYQTDYPEENLVDISFPTFHSNYEHSIQRTCDDRHLTQENLEDISCPSFETTPKCPPRRKDDFQFQENLEDITCPSFETTPKCPPRRKGDLQSHGPKRQLFPRQALITDEVERPGDYRQVFESMPNYAPFDQQVLIKRNPIPSKLKMPVTFQPNINAGIRYAEMRCPTPQMQPSKGDEMRRRAVENLRLSRIKPPIDNQRDGRTLQMPIRRNQMEPSNLAPKVATTRIPPPPSRHPQANIQHQQQQHPELSKHQIPPANQERLLKKSSFKYHQTKSTYFKNDQERLNKN